jgi:hypothetical protein
MGNEAGKPTCPLGIAAMAATCANIEIVEVTILFGKCAKLAQANGNPDSMTRADLEAALKEKGLEHFQPSDSELLDKIFTMFDDAGEGTVDLKEYFVAISTLIAGMCISQKVAVLL